MLVQILPAVWVWAAMADLRAHVLHGHSFTVLHGPVLIPIILAITAITVASFFLNAVFAFAISQPGKPEIRLAVGEAQRHWRPIVASGAVVGLLLGLSTTVVTRWGSPWFALSLGIVTAAMMVCYVSVPARLIGARPVQTRRDKLTTNIVSSVLGAFRSAREAYDAQRAAGGRRPLAAAAAVSSVLSSSCGPAAAARLASTSSR